MTPSNSKFTGPHVYAVILAGGSGTRFWPKSRQSSPKQLCKIGPTNATMIEQTLARLDGFIPPERRLIVTHVAQLAATRELVGDRCGHILAEPEARNTAAALALAAIEITHLSPKDEPVMVSLHADHVITNENEFRLDLTRAIAVAEQGYLTLLGIKPRYPETGYGYIEVGEPTEAAQHAGGFKVASFREKPDLQIAKEYVAQDNFLWNSGYFVWQTSVILDELKQHLPDTYERLWHLSQKGNISFNDQPPEKLAAVYGNLTKVAIDHAVLETSSNVAVIKTDFGWYDIGSWDAMTRCFSTDASDNFVQGDSFVLDCTGSVIESDGPFVAAIGLTDMIVVACKGAVLVCPKDRAQEVKAVVDYLTESGRTDLL